MQVGYNTEALGTEAVNERSSGLHCNQTSGQMGMHPGHVFTRPYRLP